MLEIPTGRPKISLPSWISFSMNREEVSTDINFVNVIYTHSEPTLPIKIKNNKYHQTTLSNSRVGFSSLEITDEEEPKLQNKNPHELTKAILTTDDKYKGCFLLLSTIHAQSPDECLQIIHSTEHSKLKEPHCVGQCI